MLAYWFRFIDDSGVPTGHIGLAFGKNSYDVATAIDEFGNPYLVQIKTAHIGGYCKHVEEIDSDFETSEYEFSESEPFLDDDGWRTPPWTIEAMKGGKHLIEIWTE